MTSNTRIEWTNTTWNPVTGCTKITLGCDNLEERGLDVQLVNARDARSVPGRKTDINDAQWLQNLNEFAVASRAG
jgi:protein gp37